MRLHALRDVSADGDFPAAPAVVAERAAPTAFIAVFPARVSRRGMGVTAPDGDDRLPRLPTDIARLRWPAWAAAVAVHLAFVAAILTGVLSRTEPTPSDAVEIALVFEPTPEPNAVAPTESQPETMPAPTPAEAPPIPLEPPPPLAKAVEPAPAPPSSEPQEPQAVEQAALPPEDPAPPPPRPMTKPAPTRRASKPAPAIAHREAAPAPRQAPAGTVGETENAAPPSVVAAAPLRTTPVGNLSRNRKPDYPAEARRRGQQGRALLRVEVSAAGAATDVRLVASSGYPVLDEAALTAVREWRFDPATVDSRPVEGAVEVPIRFRLDD
ncbi:MAG: TonB family protein [Rhodospirillales bacterium]|nr:TonB family protein [Rhodospirillales bacterium]